MLSVFLNCPALQGNLHLSDILHLCMVASLLFVLQIERIDKVIPITGKNPTAF